MKLIQILAIVLFISGCSSLVPGNFVNSRLAYSFPDNNNICLTPSQTSPSALNSNDILKAELQKGGLLISCEEPYVIGIWSHEIGNGQVETYSVPGVGSSSSAASCAGGVCSGTGSSSYTPGHTVSSVKYERVFLLNIYEANSLPDNPKILWSMELTSRGAITQLNKLMKTWAPIIASNWGKDINNEFVPNSGMSLLMD